jgi:hypothetical protein
VPRAHCLRSKDTCRSKRKRHMESLWQRKQDPKKKRLPRRGWQTPFEMPLRRAVTNRMKERPNASRNIFRPSLRNWTLNPRGLGRHWRGFERKPAKAPQPPSRNHRDRLSEPFSRTRSPRPPWWLQGQATSAWLCSLASTGGKSQRKVCRKLICSRAGWLC